MARVLRLLLVVAIAGGVSFFVTRHFFTVSPPDTSEMDWLAGGFDLDPQQRAKIADLHAAYRPVCLEHCDAIVAAQDRIAAAQSTPERQIAEAEMHQLEIICHQSTRTHLEAVAAVMAPGQSQRYLELISPRLSDHRHVEPFGLK